MVHKWDVVGVFFVDDVGCVAYAVVVCVCTVIVAPIVAFFAIIPLTNRVPDSAAS